MKNIKNFLEYQIDQLNSENEPRVFLSHQQEDKVACERIAEYFDNAGIYVYFDERDQDLSRQRRLGNGNAITDIIVDAISKCNHMLCVISKNTMDSKWVPFEVGYGFTRVTLGVCTLEDASDIVLPDYFDATSHKVRGIRSINEYISAITGQSEFILESRDMVKAFSGKYHPLEGILNKYK